MAQLLETEPVSSSDVLPVFLSGKYEPTSKSVDSSRFRPTSPPKPLLIVTPSEEGTYPVILFFHGFILRNNFYTQLFNHISSHGFIIVAPQLYGNIPPKGMGEVESAAKVAEWLRSGLQSVLPENIEGNLEKLALVGHSRGGKTAFALALGYGKPTQKFSALVGIDPVDGTRFGQTTPKILKYVPGSFDFSIPVTVIGTGLGPESKGLVSCPCAPKKFNHDEFFNECNPPRAHFDAKDYGHMDMLNDDLPGIIGTLANSICLSRKCHRDPMRRCVGGIVVAFLNYYFEDNKLDFNTIVKEHQVAPVELDQYQFYPLQTLN